MRGSNRRRDGRCRDNLSSVCITPNKQSVTWLWSGCFAVWQDLESVGSSRPNEGSWHTILLGDVLLTNAGWRVAWLYEYRFAQAQGRHKQRSRKREVSAWPVPQPHKRAKLSKMDQRTDGAACPIRLDGDFSGFFSTVFSAIPPGYVSFFSSNVSYCPASNVSSSPHWISLYIHSLQLTHLCRSLRLHEARQRYRSVQQQYGHRTRGLI